MIALADTTTRKRKIADTTTYYQNCYYEKEEAEKDNNERENKEHISDLIKSWYCPVMTGTPINQTRIKKYWELGYSKFG